MKKFFKIALFHGEQIAKEEAKEPRINGKYNTEELSEFYHRISKNIKYDNNNKIVFHCQYISQ